MTAWTLACISMIISAFALAVSFFRPYPATRKLQRTLELYIMESRKTTDLIHKSEERDRARRALDVAGGIK